MLLAELIDRVERRAPFSTPGAAEKATFATLSVLGEVLPPQLARELSRVLPEEFESTLCAGRGPQDLAEEDFYLHVSRKAGLSHAQAVERSQVVLSAVSSTLEPELRARVKRELPDSLGELLLELPTAMVPRVVHHDGHATTLSQGRSGSTRPLSEAAPGSTHPLHSDKPRTAQSGSVARAKNPHGDTKLSSAQGTTQEREHETLAEGKPRVDH